MTAAADGLRADGVRRPRLMAAVMLLQSLMGAGGAHAGSPASGFARAEPLPSAPWAARLTGYVPMADGVRLRYSVLLPRAEGRFPVVLNYNGYDAGMIGGAAYRQGRTVMSPDLDRALLAQGYAVMGLNVRGTSCSGGDFGMFDPGWGRDGAAAVEWAAAQPWSSGAVGMANWSFSGLSQLAVAAERPPHLKAIAPGMVVTDLVRDVSAPGGVLNQEFPLRWWFGHMEGWIRWMEAARLEGDEECVANTVRNLAVAQRSSPPVVQNLHRWVDGWTAARALEERTGRIEIPVLSIEAWQDESTGVRGGHYRRTLAPEQTWYLGSNGGHNLYPNRHIQPVLLAFFDRFLKGIDNGFERRPRATLFMETQGAAGAPADQASAAPAWVLQYPQAALPVQPRTFLLGSEGKLASGASARPGVDRYAYPVSGPAVNTGTGWGPQAEGWAQGSLHYTTAPLDADLLLAGGASADLWVSVDAVDADLQVTLTEVRPDGQEQYVQRGWLRLSDRALDPERSTPLSPWYRQTHEAMQPLIPGEPVQARVEIHKFAHAFRSGSRLRIWLEAPSATGVFGFPEPRQPATISVYRGGARSSKLVVGVLEPSGPIPPARGDCARMLHQPCRMDPLAPEP